MDYPDRKPKARRGPPGPEDVRKEPELRLAEYSAPFGEEYPWRDFGPELPALEPAAATLRPPRGRMN